MSTFRKHWLLWTTTVLAVAGASVGCVMFLAQADGTPDDASSEPAINTIETIVDDMRRPNDAKLKGVNPDYGFAKGPGFVVMGNTPRGRNTPAWFQTANPALVNERPWNYMTAWFVHFEGEGNTARNTRIQFRKLRAFTLSKASGKWTLRSTKTTPGATYCPQSGNYFHCPNNTTFRKEQDGSYSYLPRPGFNIHGWWGGIMEIDASDIEAVAITYQARLIPNDPQQPDDRSHAIYLAQAGGDYYPEAGRAKTVYPSIGMSRSKRLTSQWQSVSFTTLSDAGIQEPGGGIPAERLRENPFPMD